MNAAISNVIWLLVEHGGRLLATLIINGLLARQLGVDGFGVFQYAFAILAVSTSITYVCGTEVILPRLVKVDDEASLMVNGFSVRLIFGVLAYIVLTGYAYLFESRQTFLLLVVIGTILLINEPFGIIVSWMQSRMIAKIKVMAALIGLAAKLMVIYLIARFNQGSHLLYGVAWLVESVLVASLLTKYYFSNVKAHPMIVSKEKMMVLVLAGSPYFVGLLATSLFSKLDGLIAKNILGAASTGAYYAASQLTQALTAVSPLIALPIATKYIFKSDAADSVKYKTGIKITIALGMLGVGVATIASFLSEFMVIKIYGPNFEGAVAIFQVLLVSVILISVESFMTLMLVNKRAGNYVLLKSLLGLAGLLTSGIYLGGRFGAVGVAMSTIFAYTLTTIFAAIMNYRLYNQEPKNAKD